MEFRDLKKQYEVLSKKINQNIEVVMREGNFIDGRQVDELERRLAEYVGVKHCITCANGTDALQLALMVWNIGPGDAVFVPDFTFFSSAEVISLVGATPIFVDVCKDTFNIDPVALENAVEQVQQDGKLRPAVAVAVDLFGLPADYKRLKQITEKYGMYILEDGAQGFGGRIGERRACSFGDISTTSFFPAKPLGCYGDGGAVFTDNDEWAMLLRSYKVHGKGKDKYDNVRIGLNSRLDTIQASILLVKLEAFYKTELEDVNCIAGFYSEELKKYVKIPQVKEPFYSSWAQYSILLNDSAEREQLQVALKEQQIPSMIYYKTPLHLQRAFEEKGICYGCSASEDISKRVLSLPMSPYLSKGDAEAVVKAVKDFFE